MCPNEQCRVPSLREPVVHNSNRRVGERGRSALPVLATRPRLHPRPHRLIHINRCNMRVIHKILLSAAWGQLGAALMFTPATLVALGWFIRRRRNRNKTQVVNCAPQRPQTTNRQDPDSLQGS